MLVRSALALRRVAGAALDLLWPPVCPACGDGMEPGHDDWLCYSCLPELPLISGPTCGRCGMPMGPFEDSHRGRFCADCGSKHLVFRRAACAGTYEGPLARVITTYKYTPRARYAHLARKLSSLLVHRINSEECNLEAGDADLVIPVPAHPGKTRERGFDTTAEIARYVARDLGLPMQTDILVKTRSTRPQMGLTRDARLKNVKDSFKVMRPEAISNRLVLLIDDVMTTCATAEECARTLRNAGATEIRVATVARALEGRTTPAHSETDR